MAAVLLFLHLSALLFLFSTAQQPYTGNLVLDCYNTNGSSTLGYTCADTTQPPCQSYLFFRSTAPYQSPVSIAYLLNSSAPSISALNSAVDVLNLPAAAPVLVPVPCSCSSPSGPSYYYYQHSTNYTLKWKGETYMIVATTTFQGLSACQAMMAQNPTYDSRQLLVGMDLRIPLRCACPSATQSAAGYKYLLTYPVVEGDDVSQIAARFGVDEQAVLYANQLAAADTIFPLTTLLIPLKKQPTKDQLAVSPAAPPPTVAPVAPSPGGSNKKWVVVGVVIGVATVALLLGLSALFVVQRRLRKRQLIPDGERPSSDYTGLSDKPALVLPPPPPPSILSDEVRRLIGSLKVYSYEELEKATGSFSGANRIKGSVYRATINGSPAAVKILKGDASNEINILKQTNHTNLIRLSGLCLHRNNTYLVFEFADNGSLDDRLRHASGDPDPDSCGLSWKTRVQIASDVAEGLNYLHNYTSPGRLHMELNSGNILLDGEFRAKLTNFGRSRPVTDGGESMPQQTRHVVGTQGYLPPEYLEHGLITPKLDVFALGVVLLELLSGKEALFSKSGGGGGGGKEEVVMLSGTIGEVLRGEDVREKLKVFLDPCLGRDYPMDSVFHVAQLAERCVAKEAASRPSMADVFVALSVIQSAVLDWDPSSERSDSMPHSHSFGR